MRISKRRARRLRGKMRQNGQRRAFAIEEMPEDHMRMIMLAEVETTKHYNLSDIPDIGK